MFRPPTRQEFFVYVLGMTSCGFCLQRTRATPGLAASGVNRMVSLAVVVHHAGKVPVVKL